MFLLDKSLKTMSRRDFLKQAATAVVGLGLATACGATPTPTPQPTATKPPAAAPTAPAATPTVAPAAPTATKPPAAPAATATPAAAAKPTQAGDMRTSLIGKLEGPTIVETIPATFKEAPDLAELVKQGKLPPVKERIGQDPIVVKPVHAIGKYGGIWRRGFTGPGDDFNGWRAASGADSLLFWDYTAQKVIPNIVKSMEMTSDGKQFTFRLRRGMKWSDGQPFTADDIMFWFEDIHNNKDLNPTPTTYMAVNGKYGTVEKIDEYTVVFKFPEPYYMFPRVVAGTTVFGQSFGAPRTGGYAPKHYLKQFHPRYVDKAELDKKVADAKFDNWVNYFVNRATWALNPDLPVVSPWKTVQPKNTPQWILERNPYSVWVDTEGNQLPYIDKIVMTLAENLEVLNLRAIAGEYDFQARHITLSKLPVLIQNQDKGNYKVRLDIGNYGADLIIWVDLWYQKDKFIGDLLRNVDFRRAMSIGINRDELNETFWLGTGSPGNALPGPENPYSPGAEWRQKWAQYDPKLANQMLDKLGLDKKDAQGFRLRPDGQRLRMEMQTKGAQFLEYTAMAEMIKEHWAKLGVELIVKEVERALGYTNEFNNETQWSLWTGDGSDDFYLWTASGLPTAFGGYAEYFNSFGAKGKENQPPELIKMTEIWWKGPSLPDKEREEAGKEFWRAYADSCIQIGVVGLGAAAQGVRVHKNNLGNAPDRQYCTPWVKNPAISRPQTFYWKS